MISYVSLKDEFPCPSDSCFDGYQEPIDLKNFRRLKKCTTCEGRAYVLPHNLKLLVDFLESQDLYDEQQEDYGYGGEGVTYSPLLSTPQIVRLSLDIINLLKENDFINDNYTI